MKNREHRQNGNLIKFYGCGTIKTLLIVTVKIQQDQQTSEISRRHMTFSEHNFLNVLNFFIVWFQKISIPPPRKVAGISEGEGGSKREISEGRGGSR